MIRYFCVRSAISAAKTLLLSSTFVLGLLAGGAPSQSPPSFYRDVLPVLQTHCQSCHRPGEIAPFPLETYPQTKNWAAAIRADVESRKRSEEHTSELQSHSE